MPPILPGDNRSELEAPLVSNASTHAGNLAANTALQVATVWGADAKDSLQLRLTARDAGSRVAIGSEWGDSRTGVDESRLMADVDACVVGREMLEQLLADLTENHQRERTESTRMATEKSPPSLTRTIDSVAVDAVYELLGPVEGGMIALTLNREASVQDFNELSDDIRNENVAWMASLGIIRSFERGGLATTEISGLINRTVQTPCMSMLRPNERPMIW